MLLSLIKVSSFHTSLNATKLGVCLCKHKLLLSLMGHWYRAKIRGLCQHLVNARGDFSRSSEFTPKSLKVSRSCCTLVGRLMIASIPISTPICIPSSMFAKSHLCTLAITPVAVSVQTQLRVLLLNVTNPTLPKAAAHVFVAHMLKKNACISCTGSYCANHVTY